MDPAPFARLARQVVPGAALLEAAPLAGGVSARVTRLDLRVPDGTVHRLVVRQHGEANRRRDPGVAAHEFGLLRALTAAGLPVPEPLHLSLPGDPFPEPALVVTFVEGSSDLAPAERPAAARQLAHFLARLHGSDAAPFLNLPPLPGPGPRPAVLDEALSEGRIRDALDFHWPPPAVLPVPLHGDFWPGNTLWRGAELAAVLDWEDAAPGDPLADLANARLEVLWAWGEAALRAFTDQYAERFPLDPARLAVWDLWAALRPAGRLAGWGLDPAREAWVRADHQRFVDSALARLG